MPLSDATLRALKPRDKPYIETDGRGLYVEVFPTGGIVWRYRYRLSGKQEKLTLGKYPDLTLKNARLKRDEAGQAVAMGHSPASEKQRVKRGVASKTSVRELGERYLKEVAAKDRKDITMPRRYFERCIVPAIGTKAICDVTVDDVRNVIWRKKDEGFDAAAGYLRGLLKRIFDYAITLGLTATNPIAALPMRHVHRAKARDRALTPSEVTVFLRGLFESNIRRQFKAALYLVLLTMVRKSELMLAKWEQVDLERGEWEIPIENSKTGKPHVVYLPTQAVSLFRELRLLAGDSELVLPGRSSPLRPFALNAMNQALKVAMKGSDIAAFTIHDLRRTASTLLHEQGWGSDVVEKALNHTIGGVRGVYNRAQYAPQRREMLQSWADYLEGLLMSGSVIRGRVLRLA